MPAVIIRVLSDEPSPTPIQGVVVEFYNTSAVFQTSGTTDGAGEVQVTLPTATYDVLFYKQGVSILPKQPQEIVVDAALSNTFVVSGHVKVRPESIDPLKCTVSGFIKGVGGEGTRTRIVFRLVKDVAILSSNIIGIKYSAEFTSDETGYFEFELLRNMKYDAFFVYPDHLFGMEPGQLDVVVPNQPSVGLDNLLFPIPINLSFSATTLSLTAGAVADESITYALSYSDGSQRSNRSNAWAGIQLTNTDNTIVDAAFVDGALVIKPLNPGTVTLSSTRHISDRANIDPLPSYTTNSLVVTVT